MTDHLREARTVKMGILLLVGALAATTAVLTACRGNSGGEAIRITLPAGSPIAAQHPAATPVRDLAPLRAVTDGAGLEAAGKFGPAGLAIPGGLEVAWPLPRALTAGSKLWIVYLEEKAGRWVAGGGQATVDATGRRAAGTVYHFSTIGVSSTKPAKDEEEPQAGPPHGFSRGVKIVTSRHKTKTIDPAKLEAAKKVYEKWVKSIGQGPLTLAGMKELYRAGDFDTIKTLIENKVISPEHSTDMGDLRTLMMFQTWERIVDDSGGKLRVHRSDSGNQKEGMSSDVDQTIYVEKYEDGRWIRVEAEDAQAAALFKTLFEAMHKLKPEALAIETTAGRDKHPDWRVTSVQLDADGRRQFDVHAAETLFTLKRTPGAYTYCGAVVQQMQLRVLDAMEGRLRAGGQAPEIKDPRVIRVAELREHNKDFRLNHLLFNTVEADPETGKARAHEAFQEDATRVMFDGLPPKLVAGHAYDASVANYFEFMHHLNDKYPDVKYHLRALDDGFQMLERLRKGEARFEYANVHKDHRAEHLARIFGDSLAKAPPDLNGGTFLSRWQTAFDISANLRDLHNKNKLTDESAELVFKPLAEEVAGADKANWKNYLGPAREEYNRRCQEFMVHAICETSKERIGEFLAPDPDAPEKRAVLEKAIDEGALRKQLKLEGKKNAALWSSIREEFLRNYSEQARLQLLYSFRELNATRPDIVDFILKEAERRGHTPEQTALLRQVNGESKSYFFSLREFAKFPKTYLRYPLRNPAISEGGVKRVFGSKPRGAIKRAGLCGGKMNTFVHRTGDP